MRVTCSIQCINHNGWENDILGFPETTESPSSEHPSAPGNPPSSGLVMYQNSVWLYDSASVAAQTRQV
jgi:hypothetical protein